MTLPRPNDIITPCAARYLRPRLPHALIGACNRAGR